MVTAYHSAVTVNASGTVPSGSEIRSGNATGAEALNELNFATNSPTIITNPTMIVIVSVITRTFSHFRVEASAGETGVSFIDSEARRMLVQIRGTAPLRLDKALARELPADAGISRSRIARLIRSGCVSLDGVVVSEPDTAAKPGEVWTVEDSSEGSEHIEAEELPLNVLYDDQDVIVLDKAAGMVVHPGRGHRSGTLVNALLHRFGEGFRTVGGGARPGIVHRLDKDTTGVMVAAKSGRAMMRLGEQFRDRNAFRRYQAIVRGMPVPGPGLDSVANVRFEADRWVRIEGSIARHPKNRMRMTVVRQGGRHAVTRVRVLRPLANRTAALVECRLETGRTHQIRVHMELAGHPLIGDPLYGASARILPESAGDAAREAAAGFPRQALHAVLLEFSHPATGERMRFESPVPEDMRRLLHALSAAGDSGPNP